MKCALIITVIMSVALMSKESQGQSLQWTSFEQLGDSLRLKEKPLMVFIHTDWCKYCKMQEKITFKDPELAKLLNQDYYCLMLDAEQKEEIQFLNRSYGSATAGDFHELAKLLGSKEGTLLLPTTVLYYPQQSAIIQLQGMQQAADLIEVIAK